MPIQKFVADLHIHSHYSRATSKTLDLEHLSHWGQLKGVDVIGTGDIAHPGWLAELQAKLEPDPNAEGLFRLKNEVAQEVQAGVPPACQRPVHFMLAGEISNIYKRHDKVRKVHNVIFAPDFQAVEKIQAALEKIGNIRSDGRPILGLDSHDLLEIILEIDPQCYLIPAHIWTPWFSMLGSKSGFDSVEECFGDLTEHIFALETGLSSDPPMNWRVSNLDGYTLISNSDAHSPPKLAREANLFNTERSYPAVFAALKSGDPDAFLGSFEFFPEEGKYHMDGHRKCGVCWHPQTTQQNGNRCSGCGKPVTVGVMHRVEMLADRAEGEQPHAVHPYRSLIPLPEILSEIHGVGVNTKRVRRSYEPLLAELGSELGILFDASLQDIQEVGGDLLAEGIRRMRGGEITTVAGYDGEYGVIKLFEKEERNGLSFSQIKLFALPEISDIPNEMADSTKMAVDEQGFPFAKEAQSLSILHEAEPSPSYTASETMLVDDTLLAALNPQQRAAASCIDRPLLIVAGPGTGKTRTLTYRIAHLITEQQVLPTQILAITFTNKAATEMGQRLQSLVGEDMAQQMVIKTFHALGGLLLREHGEAIGLDPAFAICTEQDRQRLLKQAVPTLTRREINRTLSLISAAKNQLLSPGSSELQVLDSEDDAWISHYVLYEAGLRQNQAVDFDDLISRTVELLESHEAILHVVQQRFQWISVDEYQDVNLAQYRLLRLLTAGNANLCAIGDPDQAIYGFRGADRTYFLQFHEDYPQAHTLHLSQNYRSTQSILRASRQVIMQDKDQDTLEIWSDIIDQARLDTYTAPTDKAEAEYVVHQIEQMVGGTSYFSLDSGRVLDDQPTERSFGDFAVLYRLGMQSHLLAEAFDRSGIPYQTGGQMPFYERKIISEVLAYLWYAQNPSSFLHLDRILNSRRETFDLDTLTRMAEASKQAPDIGIEFLANLGFLKTGQKRQLMNLKPILAQLQEAQSQHAVADLLDMIVEFLATVHKPINDEDTILLEQLRLQATPYEHALSRFLEATALQGEADLHDSRADRVTLMTLHAAKGLEFPVVFIVGCEETLLPYEMPRNMTKKASDVDEERRLFYVGMTRAEQKLVLTRSQRRLLFGQHIENPPSRFLNDIEETLKEVRRMVARKNKPTKQRPVEVQLSLF